MQCHREKRAKAFVSMAREKPRKWTIGLLAVAALALVTHGASAAAPLVPLDRNPTEILSRDWLRGNVGAPGRRITTKSIFIAPQREQTLFRDCPKNTWLSGVRCVPFLHLDEGAREQILLDQLNAQYSPIESTGSVPNDGYYDYEETIPEAQGPLQVHIPLGPPLIRPTPPRAISSEQAPKDKPISIVSNAAISLNTEEIIKEQNATKLEENPTLVDQLESLKVDDVAEGLLNNPNPIDTIVNVDGNMAITDEYIVGPGQIGVSTEKVVEQPELDVSKPIDHNFTSATIIEEEPILVIAENTTNNSSLYDLSLKPNNTAETKTVSTKMTNEKSSYIKSKIKDKIKYDEHLQNKLRPELDYSDLSEAIKIISRFAEITTDDTFKEKNMPRDPYYTELYENPLGTRTKLEHVKKFSRYNKQDSNSGDELSKKTESDDNPLQLNPSPMEYMKREVKDSWQIPHMQEYIRENPSHEDQRDFARHHNQRIVSQNPIRHRRLYQRPSLENLRRGKPGRAAMPQSEDLFDILGLARHV